MALPPLQCRRARATVSTAVVASIVVLCPVAPARAGVFFGVGAERAAVEQPADATQTDDQSDQPDQPDQAEAAAIYGEGEKAYRLGRFDEAAEAFERAYELSGLPEILYDIGLAYLRRYDVDPDPAHLRQAKVVLENYTIELQKDPGLGELAEVEALMAQIDAKLSEHEADESEALPVAAEPTDDAGRRRRIGGAVAMGIGGALIVGGVAGAVAFGLSGQRIEEDLDQAYDASADLGCMPGETRTTCRALGRRIDTLRSDGRSANTSALAIGISLGATGAAALITGAVLFAQGKRAKATERKLSVGPQWLPAGGGVVLSGRF